MNLPGEVVHPSLRDKALEQQALELTRNLHETQQAWAARCAKKYFQNMVVDVWRVDQGGVGMDMAITNATDDTWLYTFFANRYGVDKNHLDYAVLLVRKMFVALCQGVLER